jgi:glycosyltransferase involved in cell wall biosynthesis
VSRPDNMKLLRAVSDEQPDILNGARLVYDAEALFSARTITQSAHEGNPISEQDERTLIDNEVALAEGTQAVICVNDAEAKIFQSRLTAPVQILSHPVDLRSDTPGFAARAGFLFVGRLLERDAPNWIGLSWFVKNVWPSIIASLPTATLTVAGHLRLDCAELQGRGVKLLGPLANLDFVYNTARVFVAPTLFGAGLPIKVLEATSAGVPTICTNLVASQLGWSVGHEIVADDDAKSFASSAVALHEDITRWTEIRVAAQRRLLQEHDRIYFRKQLKSLMNSVSMSIAQAS